MQSEMHAIRAGEGTAFISGGVSDDFPLAAMFANQRALRLADGPDQVHKRTIARSELRARRGRRGPGPDRA